MSIEVKPIKGYWLYFYSREEKRPKQVYFPLTSSPAPLASSSHSPPEARDASDTQSTESPR